MYIYAERDKFGTDFYDVPRNYEVINYGKNIWAVEDKPSSRLWIQRISGIEKTREEAQAIIDVEKAEADITFNKSETDRPFKEIILP